MSTACGLKSSIDPAEERNDRREEDPRGMRAAWGVWRIRGEVLVCLSWRVLESDGRKRREERRYSRDQGQTLSRTHGSHESQLLEVRGIQAHFLRVWPSPRRPRDEL